MFGEYPIHALSVPAASPRGKGLISFCQEVNELGAGFVFFGKGHHSGARTPNLRARVAL